MKKRIALLLALLTCFSFICLTGCSEEAETEVRKIKVGLNYQCEPVTWVTEDGQLTGYDYDVLCAVDELLPQYEFEYDAVDQYVMLTGLQTGDYQLAAAGMMATPDRDETFLRVENPTFYYYVCLAMNENVTDINSLEDCIGKKMTPIAPNNGLYSILVKWEEENNTKLDYELVDVYEYAEAFESVIDGTYEVYLTNNDAYDIFSTLIDGWNLKSVNIDVVGGHPYTNKDEVELNKAVSDAIATLKENGTLTEISAKYYSEDVSARTA